MKMDRMEIIKKGMRTQKESKRLSKLMEEALECTSVIHRMRDELFKKTQKLWKKERRLSDLLDAAKKEKVSAKAIKVTIVPISPVISKKALDNKG